MVSLNSLDVILYIALFLDSEKEKKDLKNLSLVNHVVYEALTRRRVQNLLVYPSDLPSLALFLIRSRASKHCRSLKISHCSKNMFGPTNFENFSRALIFRMIGTCKGSALQYFEGCCSEPTPPLLWKALKPLAHKKGGPANCIQLSAENESGDKRTIKWLYPGSTSHRIRIISKKEQDSKPSTVHVHVHLPTTSSEVSKLLDPENERLQEIPSWRLSFEELLLSSHSIKEMVLRLLNPLSWDAVLRADWPCLSRLELLIHEPQRLGESPPSHPMLNALESLKISWPNSAYSPYLVLDFTIPSLRSLHFSSWGVRQSYLDGFLSRHANHLEDLSLNCKVVPALDCLDGLRALHLSYKQDMRYTYEQLDVCFQNLQNVVHLRVSAEAFRIGTTISNAPFLRNLRCLELEHLRTRCQCGFSYASNLLPELKELAFIFGEDVGDGQDLQESIPLIFRQHTSPKSLDVIRIVYKGNADVWTSDLTVKSWKPLGNVRYFIADRGNTRCTFRVTSVPVVLESAAWYNEPTEAVELQFEEIAPLRPFPPPGKRSIDWTDGCFYDHVSPNYEV